jgi:hypothetical protein
LCEGINRRSALQGLVSLGKMQARAEDFEPLLEALGSRAVSLSGQGFIRVSLDACFAGIPDASRQALLGDLFRSVGMTWSPMPPRKKQAAEQVESLLERFRLAFPDLEPVYHGLLASRARWTDAVLVKGLEDLQAPWFQAAKLTRFLRDNREPMTLADLGARVCGDSKALKGGRLLGRALHWLAMLEGGEGGGPAEGVEGPGEDAGERTARLARYHIVENPGAIKVTLFGPVIFWKRGRRFDFVREFHRDGEAATLSWENLAGVERLEVEGEGPVLGSENESPFRRLQRGGFAGVLVYTQGFPNAAVLRLWALLGAAFPDREFLHWGDSDLAGLRIASILHAVRPLRLHRCRREDLAANRASLRPLAETEKKAISRFLEGHPEFPFRAELEFTRDAGWLEQESWEASGR